MRSYNHTTITYAGLAFVLAGYAYTKDFYNWNNSVISLNPEYGSRNS